MSVELPAGQSFASDDQKKVDTQGLLGFSFTPRHDFFFRPTLGFSAGGDANTTYRGGCSAGMAYQRPRFSFVFYGSNEWHSRGSIGPRIGGGGGFFLGSEIAYGLTLGFKLDARQVPEAVGGKGANVTTGVSLSWVFFPGDRTNKLRSEDRERGGEWQLWNPDSKQL